MNNAQQNAQRELGAESNHHGRSKATGTDFTETVKKNNLDKISATFRATALFRQAIADREARHGD